MALFFFFFFFFQAARFILNAVGAKGEAPYALSRVLTLFTLAKQGKALGAYKLARYGYERLSVLKVPTTWTNQIDLDVMTLNSKVSSVWRLTSAFFPRLLLLLARD